MAPQAWFDRRFMNHFNNSNYYIEVGFKILVLILIRMTSLTPSTLSSFILSVVLEYSAKTKAGLHSPALPWFVAEYSRTTDLGLGLLVVILFRMTNSRQL